jgi:hypothetical protein
MANPKKARHNGPTAAEKLAQAIGQPARSAKFCVIGPYPM